MAVINICITLGGILASAVYFVSQLKGKTSNLETLLLAHEKGDMERIGSLKENIDNKISAVKEDIKELKTRQDVYNDLQLRFARHESADKEIKSTIFKRIDELREGKK
jgi:hypothetical protein